MNQARTLSTEPHVMTDANSRPADLAGRSNPPSRNTFTVAGLGLVVMAILAGFGYVVAVAGLVTPADATATATAIRASRGLFGLGIISLLGVVALDVVVAWALHRILAPVHRTLSAVAAGIRYLYAGVFGVAVLQLVAALQTLDAAGSTDATAAPAALLKIDAFHTIWDAGLILFGLHLATVAYLTYRSHFLPKLLGIVLAVAAVGYLFDSSAALLLTTPPPEISTITFIGEFLLALWLLFESRRTSVRADGTSSAS